LLYAFHPEAKGANLTWTTNPVPAMPTIGDKRHHLGQGSRLPTKRVLEPARPINDIDRRI